MTAQIWPPDTVTKKKSSVIFRALKYVEYK